MKHIIELPAYHFDCAKKTEILSDYIKQLLVWEKKTDLIGIKDASILWDRHIHNCLNVLHLFSEKDSLIYDIGTGAGLPGLVCAVCDKQDRRYVLFEKKYQKRSFLKNMVIRFDLKNVTIAEEFPNVSRETCDILMSRAYLTVSHMVEYQRYYKKFILFKGKNYQEEYNQIQDNVFTKPLSIYKIKQDDSYFIVGESNEFKQK